ncbi:UDP-glucosyltransferase 2-like [Leguminivora glycinivorella]|uniref:UDP-glucosyltransferase 2-like n=1 Tax=Leguminivora glycinivorella TaxID=1035111 RepID=UPI00200DE59C|nr:UDP-glucosyltransferase 2-like [Leguminivora glycinivorella]
MNNTALIVLLTLASVAGYKIMVLAPVPMRSMNILGVGYVRHLLNAGHEVTYVSVFPLREKSENLTQVDLSNMNLDIFEGTAYLYMKTSCTYAALVKIIIKIDDDAGNISYFITQPPSEGTNVEYMANSAKVAEATFQNKEMQALLHDPTFKFDVIICDYMESEMYAAYFFTGLTGPREKYFYENFFAPLFLKKNKALPNYYELMYNASLVLANDFPGNGLIPSTPQNFKFIGGYHIESATKPLSTSKYRIVLFLFDEMKPHEAFLILLNKVYNLLFYIPVLFPAHPKCLFFISHGGLLSTTESAHFGVPTIGIPIYFDQFINVQRGVQSGRTIRVDLTLNLVNDLRVAIQKMIQDPSYKQRAKEVSQMYHDRPVSPGAELVHWVEHVVRTRDAPHLRSPALMLPWYQKMFLDVILKSKQP